MAISHYNPEAIVFFVPAFGGEVVKDIVNSTNNNAILSSEFIHETKEVSNIHIMRTVKNNPGTFSMTIVDTDNKYVMPDEPDSEIATLYKHSQSKVVLQENFLSGKLTKTNKQTTVDPTVKIWTNETTSGDTGNFYTHTNYNDWLSHKNIIVRNPTTKQYYPTQFVRAKDKPFNIIQRWAFDEYGGIIIVSNTQAEEEVLQNLLISTNIITVPLIVKPYNSTASNTDNIVNFIVEAIPNKALTEGYRDSVEQGPALGKFKKGRCKLSPMDKVVIFMTPRYDDNGNKINGNSDHLIRAFTGVVGTAQQGYVENKSVVDIQGEDVTKYLKISIINVNPALAIAPDKIADQFPGEAITVWANILKGLTTPEIIRLVTLGSDALNKQGEAASYKIDGVSFYKLAQPGNLPDIVYNPEWEYDKNTKDIVATKGAINKNVRTYDYSTMLGTLFTENAVHIVNPYRSDSPLIGFRSYEMAFKNAYSFYQADFKTRRDIAYQCAEDSNFNFYADRFGEIWFHPQRFDLSWILGAPNPDVYVIKNEDIISYGFIETDDNIYTSVYVTTEPDFGLDSLSTVGYYYASYRDDVSVLKYGQRIFVCSNPIINTKSAGQSAAIPQNDAVLSPSNYKDSGWWRTWSATLFTFINSSALSDKFNLSVLSGFDTSRLLPSSGDNYNPMSFHTTGDAFDINIIYTPDSMQVTKALMQTVNSKVISHTALSPKEQDIYGLIGLFNTFATQNDLTYAPTWKGMPDWNHMQAKTRSISLPTNYSSASDNGSNGNVDPSKSLTTYAKSILQRILASKYQGQITIPLRVELDPGRPIYIPIRNMVYYVETVEHDVEFGGRATTTLHLSYGRKPWELLPELITYSSKDEIFMSDAHVLDVRRSALEGSTQNTVSSMRQNKTASGNTTGTTER